MKRVIVQGSTKIQSSSYDESQWELLDWKDVYDTDGYLTEYSLYKKIGEEYYVCIFGDQDLYDPDNTDPDFETESYQEAEDWFAEYDTNYDWDEDSVISSECIDANSLLSLKGFYQYFDPSADKTTKDQAAKILYQWYKNEDEEFMPDKDDVLDIVDVATNENERNIVLQALGLVDPSYED